MDENLQQVYAELTARCKRIKEGKYIMSGNTIAALLRYITSQPALMACLERCNYGFRYGTELEKAMTGGIFKLPLGSRKVVALVTGLLFELDRGSINFHNFIKQYYRAADVDASFDMFAGSVIMPYLMAFKNALSGEGEEVSAGLDGDDKPVSSGVKEQLMPVILQFTEEIAADEIAKEAEFFSFGTNDLTQMTFGFSRDDAGKFLGDYYKKKIFESDPFARLDQVGVGKLMKIAIEGGKETRPEIKLGICGEHGGDPSTIEFCHNVGLTYVSCSPFRVPIARLAAAQANIKRPR